MPPKPPSGYNNNSRFLTYNDDTSSSLEVGISDQVSAVAE